MIDYTETPPLFSGISLITFPLFFFSLKLITHGYQNRPEFSEPRYLVLCKDPPPSPIHFMEKVLKNIEIVRKPMG